MGNFDFNYGLNTALINSPQTSYTSGTTSAPNTAGGIPPLFNFSQYSAPGLTPITVDPSFNFSNYDPKTTFFSPFNNYGNGFGDLDFISILAQQYPMFSPMFMKSPFDFNLGMPDLGYIQQKKGRTPLSPTCCRQIEQIARNINADPRDIQALIYSESGGNPQAVNGKTGASGLIQFMPKTAASMGTSVQAIRHMSAEQQMAYVNKYLQMAKCHAKFDQNHRLTAGELYAIVFMPARAKNGVLCSQGSAAHAQNRGLDRGHKGYITTNDLGARLASYYDYIKKHWC